jgi:hypothetical protein
MARTPRQIEDERLALRCRLGEPGAFAELVKEIKGVELRLASLEERLAARGDITGTET